MYIFIYIYIYTHTYRYRCTHACACCVCMQLTYTRVSHAYATRMTCQANTRASNWSDIVICGSSATRDGAHKFDNMPSHK